LAKTTEDNVLKNIRGAEIFHISSSCLKIPDARRQHKTNSVMMTHIYYPPPYKI
jgi:hypothetical protein